MTKGKLITFEGDDAAGKSTQVTLLETALRERGMEVLKTREPGGTPVGERLRELLLHNGDGLDGVGETLLMFAARRVHLQQKILPALDAGTWVICDRFTDSTLAYQGGGRGVDEKFIAELITQVLDDTTPDLTFYLHTPPSNARNPLLGDDTFEREGEDFRLLVAAAFQQLAKDNPRIVQISNHDAQGEWRAREEISADIWRIVAERLF